MSSKDFNHRTLGQIALWAGKEICEAAGFLGISSLTGTEEGMKIKKGKSILNTCTNEGKSYKPSFRMV